MNIRQVVHTAYQVGKLIAQASIVYMEFDDLTEGKVSRNVSATFRKDKPLLHLINVPKRPRSRRDFKPYRPKKKPNLKLIKG